LKRSSCSGHLACAGGVQCADGKTANTIKVSVWYLNICLLLGLLVGAASGATAVAVDVLRTQHQQEGWPAVDSATDPHGLEQRQKQVQSSPLEGTLLLGITFAEELLQTRLPNVQVFLFSLWFLYFLYGVEITQNKTGFCTVF